MSFKRRSLYCIDIPMQYVLQVAWTDAVGGLFHNLQETENSQNKKKREKQQKNMKRCTQRKTKT